MFNNRKPGLRLELEQGRHLGSNGIGDGCTVGFKSFNNMVSSCPFMSHTLTSKDRMLEHSIQVHKPP